MTKQDEKFRKFLQAGGQRRSFTPGQVLYEPRGGGKPSERVTYLDRANDARALMSWKIQLPDELRAVGNYYGHCVQFSELGAGTSFAQESLDGGKHATGGVTVRMIEARQAADIAQAAMAQMPPLTHKTNRGKFPVGPHRDIQIRALVDAICVHGQDVTETAFRAGWWARRGTTEKGGSHFLPKRQHQKLAEALRAALEAVDAAFLDHNIDARRILGVVEVR